MDNFTKCIITTYKHQLVEFKGDHYYSILKDNILFNNTIIPNVEESIIIKKQYLVYLKIKLITEKNTLNTQSNISYLINIDNIDDIFEVSFNIYNLKKYVSYDSNLINNYNVVFLNNYLKLINNKIKNKFNYEIEYLLQYINDNDIRYNIDNIKYNDENLENYYLERHKILNAIDFIIILLKN